MDSIHPAPQGPFSSADPILLLPRCKCLPFFMLVKGGGRQDMPSSGLFSVLPEEVTSEQRPLALNWN